MPRSCCKNGMNSAFTPYGQARGQDHRSRDVLI
jgi:hypothetical protein